MTQATATIPAFSVIFIRLKSMVKSSVQCSASSALLFESSSACYFNLPVPILAKNENIECRSFIR